MNLLILTLVEEEFKSANEILKQAGVEIYSISETIGMKPNQEINVSENWFGSLQSNTKSFMVYCFTNSETSKKVIEKVNQYNKQSNCPFPIKAFSLLVNAQSN